MNTQTEEAAEKVKQYILSTGNKINENTIAHAIIFSKKFDDLTGKDADEINRLLLNFKSQEQEVKTVGDAEIEGWDMKHKPKIAEQIAAYVHEIDSLRETNRKLGEKIAALQPEAEQPGERIFNNIINTQAVQIQELQKEIDEKNKEICDLLDWGNGKDAELERLEKDIAGLTDYINQQYNRIVELVSKVDERDKKISEIQNDFMQVQTNEQIARFDKEDRKNK